MNILELITATYGLVISPIVGFRLVKWRVYGGVSSFGKFILYLFVGLTNAAAIVLTFLVLPEGSWLKLLAMVILILFIGAYSYTQVDVNMD